MATINVRRLDEDGVNRLKQRASRNNRSLEGERCATSFNAPTTIWRRSAPRSANQQSGATIRDEVVHDGGIGQR